MVEPPAPSARDREEASIVVGQQSGHQFEIQLGHLCNNRCVFCVSGHLSQLRMARPLEVQPILDTITKAREDGAERLIFLGGEPTLQRGFLPALEHASKLGFSEIVIFTNGVRLPTDGFIDTCLSYGKFTWRISIQGANEASHVAVTKKPNSFKRIVQGIRMLQERGQRVTTNMCVTAASYESLPDYPELVRTYDIKQLHIDIVRPESSGIQTEEYLREIMPQYSKMAPYYDAMMRGFEESDPDFDVNIGNLPYCVLPQWGHRIHHGGENTVTQSAGHDGLEENAVDKYAVHRSQRAHMEKCTRCAFRPRCTGVFRHYLALYGDEEFQPVSIAHLREVDPQMNNFTDLAAPLLEPVFDASNPPPTGWRLAEHFADARSRRVELRFQRSAGGGATVFIAPPLGVGRPQQLPQAILATDRYRVALGVEGWFPAEDLTALTEWLADTLASARGVIVTSPLDAAVVAAARGEDPVLSRSRARLMRLVRAVQRKARFGGWRYSGTKAREDGTGVDISVVGPEGMGVVLGIGISATDGRSRVDAEFSLAEGTPPNVARPVVEDLVATLKSAERRAQA